MVGLGLQHSVYLDSGIGHFASCQERPSEQQACTQKGRVSLDRCQGVRARGADAICLGRDQCFDAE